MSRLRRDCRRLRVWGQLLVSPVLVTFLSVTCSWGVYVHAAHWLGYPNKPVSLLTAPKSSSAQEQVTSAGPWQCGPANSPGNDHTWGEVSSSWQSAPRQLTQHLKLRTEAYVSIFLWLWKEGCWLHVMKLKKIPVSVNLQAAHPVNAMRFSSVISTACSAAEVWSPPQVWSSPSCH